MTNNKIEKHFKKNRLSAFISASSLCALTALSIPLYAQESTEAAADDSALEEIEVTGFRRSLLDAISNKRDAGNVTDGISAEDIGKSADQNIAEALQRITGVSIDRSGGEGTTVTVRGIDPNLNNVTLNGVTVTNGSGNVRDGAAGQAVDFSAFNADILSRIEVIKTPSADHDEGSLGAAIELSTFKPLSAAKGRRSIEAQGRYNEFADDNGTNLGDLVDDMRYTISLSDKFLDDSFGVSFVGTTEEFSGRSDSVRVARWQGEDASNGSTNPNVSDRLTGGFTNDETGNLDTNGATPESVIRVMAPFEVGYDQNYYSTKRDNITTSFQYQPSENTDIQLDLTYSKVDRDTEESQFNVRHSRDFFPFWQGLDTNYDPSSQTMTKFRNTAYTWEPGMPGNAVNPSYIRPVQQIEDTTEKTTTVGLNIEHIVDKFTFSLGAGYSASKTRDDEFIYATAQIENQAMAGPDSYDNGFNGFDDRGGLTQGFDCKPGQACSIFLSDTVDNRTQGGTNGANPNLAIVDDAFEFDVGSIGSRDRAIDDTSKALNFDVDWDIQAGPLTVLEAGIKWNKRNRVQTQTNSNITRFDFPGLERQNILPWAIEGQQALRNGFGSELGLARDSITDGMMSWDPIAMRADIQQVKPDAGTTMPALVNDRDLTNEIFAGYIMANYEFMDGRLWGDVGVRYANTKVDVEGGATATVSFDQFTTRPENLAYFGYLGDGNPGNTATLEEAQTQLVGIFGADLVPRSDPSFVEPLGGVAVEDSHEYSNVLPSLNVNFALNEDMLLRFAASQTMARPNIDVTRPNFQFQENVFGDSFANGGNPQLDPFKSNNLDVSFEWYFAEGSLLSLALFNKDLTDSERRVAQTFLIRDPRDYLFDANGVAITDPAEFGSAIGEPGFIPGQASLLLPYSSNNQPSECLPNRVFDISLLDGVPGCEVVQVNQPINAGKANVRGLEAGVQHNFDWLPGFWSGFGFTANYTYSDSEVEAQTIVNSLGQEVSFRAAPLPNTSLHTVNSTVFYEKDGLLLRLAYNWRSDFLRSSAPEVGGARIYSEGYDTLDFSAGYDITKDLRLSLQAVNLLDTVRRDYAVLEVDADVPNAIEGESLSLGDTPTDRTQFMQNTGRIYRVGLRYQF